MDMVVNQFGVYLVDLDPTRGSEIRKTRPCMVISPTEMNMFLNTVIVVPMTSTIKNYPIRLNCTFENRRGQLMIDQMRAIDKTRIVKDLGMFSDKNFLSKGVNVLQEMFAYQL